MIESIFQYYGTMYVLSLMVSQIEVLMLTILIGFLLVKKNDDNLLRPNPVNLSLLLILCCAFSIKFFNGIFEGRVPFLLIEVLGIFFSVFAIAKYFSSRKELFPKFLFKNLVSPVFLIGLVLHIVLTFVCHL